MNILNIEHVSKVFGEKVVLDDVSYGVHQDVYKRQILRY